jgi:hypothetical protein
LHLPRKAAHRVYWAQHPKKIHLNLDHAVLNNLADDISEKRDLTEINPEQTKELQKLAAGIRSELGDWNMEGTDRPRYSYPGNLNNPNWRKERQRAPARRKQSGTR